MGTFTLTQVIFLWKNSTFTSLLWATLLSLLYLNAIQVKNASIYSKRAVYGMILDSKWFINARTIIHGLHKFYACILLNTNKCLSIWSFKSF